MDFFGDHIYSIGPMGLYYLRQSVKSRFLSAFCTLLEVEVWYGWYGISR